MSKVAISPAQQARGLATTIAGAVLVLVRVAAALWRGMYRRREVRTLLELDDHCLRDIGLLRSDVHGALSGSILKDPTTALLVRSVARRSGLRARAVPARRVAGPALVG